MLSTLIISLTLSICMSLSFLKLFQTTLMISLRDAVFSSPLVYTVSYVTQFVHCFRIFSIMRVIKLDKCVC